MLEIAGGGVRRACCRNARSNSCATIRQWSRGHRSPRAAAEQPSSTFRAHIVCAGTCRYVSPQSLHLLLLVAVFGATGGDKQPIATLASRRRWQVVQARERLAHPGILLIWSYSRSFDALWAHNSSSNLQSRASWADANQPIVAGIDSWGYSCCFWRVNNQKYYELPRNLVNSSERCFHRFL